jgi:hypothetical protein
MEKKLKKSRKFLKLLKRQRLNVSLFFPNKSNLYSNPIAEYTLVNDNDFEEDENEPFTIFDMEHFNEAISERLKVELDMRLKCEENSSALIS